MACWGVKLVTAHPPLSRIQSTLTTGRSIQVAFSPIIAIFFGIYPASPAARLDLVRCFTIRIDFEFAEPSPCLLGKTLPLPILAPEEIVNLCTGTFTYRLSKVLQTISCLSELWPF